MAADPHRLRLLGGMVVLALLWWCWCCFAWLGNVVRADSGGMSAVLVSVMAVVLIVSPTVPEVYDDAPGGLPAPPLFVACYGHGPRPAPRDVLALRPRRRGRAHEQQGEPSTEEANRRLRRRAGRLRRRAGRRPMRRSRSRRPAPPHRPRDPCHPATPAPPDHTRRPRRPGTPPQPQAIAALPPHYDAAPTTPSNTRCSRSCARR
ncbi:low temperature requirement protein A [Streptomyces sp. NPDC057474]|uniref:low temperature requirement protein A n=1 Tax=Streptomyces sp. NPDC057474 TaxID=3346144 RepID=UPI0036C3AC27